MASIKTRNEILQYDLRYHGVRIRESSGLKTNRENKRLCEAKLRKILAEIDIGIFDPVDHFPNSKKLRKIFGVESCDAEVEPSISFETFAEQWFVEKRVEWRYSYMKTIRGTIDKYLIPTFGETPVEEITKAQILEFRVTLAQLAGKSAASTMSPSRINHIMTPLRMIMVEAADRYGFVSPWQNIKPLKEPRVQVEPFSFDEVKQILRRVRQDYRTYYIVRFLTGLRSSEVDGLKWEYVDFDRKQILVREALVQRRMVPTKTDGSMRDIDMNSMVLDALARHKRGAEGCSEYVFASSTGQPYSNRYVTRCIWYPLLKQLGLKARRPYQTRHTAATLWLASGESPEWIARQMGHTTTEMLFRVYSRYVPNLTRQDGSAFEKLLAARFSRSGSERHDFLRDKSLLKTHLNGI
ncbi:tyrosine-type recombinase/integrase [Kordiimonas aquimaris]|uniref:tyrosine-type recombinase/integrase n=1 Tax=Kordiimonas aquimaris TaxID=707591 RepID=UPI0021CE932A|nr:site-specific integrase [Kordiimonas aquimaris]